MDRFRAIGYASFVAETDVSGAVAGASIAEAVSLSQIQGSMSQGQLFLPQFYLSLRLRVHHECQSPPGLR